ncbi:MAG: L-lactate dehydrogenase [Alphaproteobacteria bacterium]|nr:L-lactate dehydrogenase [Alphaproteobacteria bacterium]
MKIGIVGCGNVGATSAYACVMRGIGSEIVMVDINPDFAKAQARDIMHATPFTHQIPVRSGGYRDLRGAGIVMIAAGVAKKKPGETRLDLLKHNRDVFADIIPKILAAAPNAILIVASNPVDVMTHMAACIADKFCGIPPGRVIGSGTILDTARFRSLLSEYLGISSRSVHGYVLGEHGDSEVILWSSTTVGNMNLHDFTRQIGKTIPDDFRGMVDDQVRNAAAYILQGKGATWFGIGGAMARLAEAIIEDHHVLLTCCTRIPEVEGVEDVCLSLPCIVSADGIENIFYPEMADDERAALKRSAEILKGHIEPLAQSIV